MSLDLARDILLVAMSVLAWIISRRLIYTAQRLSNLRRNAFLTDERGVRVKYANASRDVRERAEANTNEKEA